MRESDEARMSLHPVAAKAAPTVEDQAYEGVA